MILYDENDEVAAEVEGAREVVARAVVQLREAGCDPYATFAEIFKVTRHEAKDAVLRYVYNVRG